MAASGLLERQKRRGDPRMNPALLASGTCLLIA